jgi:hypothetical protein
MEYLQNGSEERHLRTLLSKLMKKQSNPNKYIKTFINNKLNNVLTNSNMTEKLLMYNLISSNKSNSNVNNFNENDELINSFFNQDTKEKHFQKEVIRFTIENFCKYLKENGYSIIKNEVFKKKEMICPHTDKKHYAKVVYFNVEYV